MQRGCGHAGAPQLRIALAVEVPALISHSHCVWMGIPSRVQHAGYNTSSVILMCTYAGTYLNMLTHAQHWEHVCCTHSGHGSVPGLRQEYREGECAYRDRATPAVVLVEVVQLVVEKDWSSHVARDSQGHIAQRAFSSKLRRQGL